MFRLRTQEGAGMKLDGVRKRLLALRIMFGCRQACAALLDDVEWTYRDDVHGLVLRLLSSGRSWIRTRSRQTIWHCCRWPLASWASC